RGHAAAGVRQAALPRGGALPVHEPEAGRRGGAGGRAGRRGRVEQPPGLGLRDHRPGAGRRRGRRLDPARHLRAARHRPRVARRAGAAPRGAVAEDGPRGRRGGWLMAARGALAGGAAGSLGGAAGRALGLVALTALGVAAAFAPVALQRARTGPAGPLYWSALLGGLLLAVLASARLSLMSADEAEDRAGAALISRLQRVLPVATVPFVLLLTWEGLVLGFRVPPGIFPSVVSIGQALVRSWRVLVADAYLTFVREVLFGFGLGLVLGFVSGTLIAFSAFLRRGFLPLATAFG